MLIIEKIEGDIIVIEDGEKHFNITSGMIKDSYKEGDILILNEDGKYIRDDAASQKRRSDIIKLQDSLWE